MFLPWIAPSSRRRAPWRWAAAAWILAVPLSALAQEPDKEPWEDKPVSEIRAVGFRRERKSEILPTLELRKGQPYDAGKRSRDLKRLAKKFADARIDPEFTPAGDLVFVVKVAEFQVITDVRF